MKKLLIIIFLFSTVAMFAQVERPKTDLTDATINKVGAAVNDSLLTLYLYNDTIILKLDSIYWAIRDSVTTRNLTDSTIYKIGAAVNDSLVKLFNLQDTTIAKLGKAIADSAASSASAAVPVNYVVPNQGATVTWTSSTSLTLSGLPVVISSNCQVVYIQAVLADSNRFYINSINGITMTYSGGVVTIAGASESFPIPKTAALSVGLNVPQWALDFSYNAYNVIVQNASELKTTSPEAIINEADQDSASSTSVIFNLLADGYNKFCIHPHLEAVGANDSVNMKIYGTNNTAAVSTSLSWWNDITTDITGSSIITVQAATLDSTAYNRATPLNFDRIMIRVDYWLKAAGTENNEAIIYLTRSN